MPRPSRKRPVEVLTSAEIGRLLKQCSPRAPTGMRNRALITVMYRAGLRLDEALEMRTVDLDPDAGTVRVQHGKGDQARTVAIDAGSIALMQQWADKRAALPHRHGPLFCTLKGTPLSDAYVRAMLRRISDARHADIGKRVHPHALRHTHAVELEREGVATSVIQKQLGHAHLNTTQVYLDHISPRDVIAMGRSRPPWNPEGI